MGIKESGGPTTECFPAGWSVAAKSCDFCKSAAALLFCRADSAFMCMTCDTKVHGANPLSRRHERVWLCEVCEQAPASVTCKADSATLCVTCDHDIHSANPLARRHERAPVVPFYDTAESVVKSTAAALLLPGRHEDSNIGAATGENTSKQPADCPPDFKSIEFLLSDSDHFLDLEYPSNEMGFQVHHSTSRTDSLVPVQSMKPPGQEQVIVPGQVIHHSPDSHFEIDFTRSKISPYKASYAAPSLSQSVSSSSLDFGVVPDGSCVSEISYPFGQQINRSFELSGSVNTSQGSQLVGMDREARVLRYREKRKNRKFEKTIRYASRKAYAETRPRIKGRFAKRTEVGSEIDRMFGSVSNVYVSDRGYGVVPSF